MAISGISGLDLARSTAMFHVVLGWVLALVVLRVITADRGEATPWRIGLLAGVSFLVPYGLIASFVGPELPTLGGAVLGTGAFIVVIRRWSVAPSVPAVGADPEAPGRRSIALAAAPYLALIIVVLVTRLVAPIEDRLRSVTTSGSSRAPSPGRSCRFTIQGARPSQVADAFVAATRQLATVTIALVSMVTIARLMSQSGMTADLADAAARTGAGWPVISPVVGALGTFVTGSATASNVLFTELQLDTATVRDLDVTTMLGAQGFGAAVGNAIAPHNIVAAAAIVGLAGRESEILRRTLPVTAAYLALGGARTWVLTR